MLSSLRGYILIVAWCLFVCFLASTSTTFAQNTSIDSFNHAKKRLTEVFAGHETEFYCGCTYAGNEVNLTSCGYQPKKDLERAKRLEWEHVVPAEAFGQSFPEWREGHPGPACAFKQKHTVWR